MVLPYPTTRIDLDRKNDLGISADEYCLLDLISKFPEQCTYRNISDTLGYSIGAISGMVNRLIASEYLTRQQYSDNEALMAIQQSGGGPHNHGCIACSNTRNIHQHHYPVRAKDGGVQTIPLCANCHSDFHGLADHGTLKTIIEL